jgi:hypothetical protein
MSEPVVISLRRDVRCQRLISHTGRGIRIQLSRRVSFASEISGGKGSHGGTEAVTHYDKFVVRVLGDGFFELFHDVVTDEFPGTPEAEFGQTALAEIGVCE